MEKFMTEGADMPRITALVITDGRQECMARTMASLFEMVQGPTFRVLIINDSGDLKYAAWLDHQFPHTQRVHHETRRGFAGAIQSGWDHVGDRDWILHLEDDFIINRTVELTRMMAVLAGHPHIVQLALQRQPWNDEEKAAGGLMAVHPTEYMEHVSPGGTWLEHRLFFTTNVSMYRGRLTKLGWPQEQYSEGKFGIKLLREGMPGVEPRDIRFAFWGRRDDKPWITHIGDQRVGTGY